MSRENPRRIISGRINRGEPFISGQVTGRELEELTEGVLWSDKTSEDAMNVADGAFELVQDNNDKVTEALGLVEQAKEMAQNAELNSSLAKESASQAQTASSQAQISAENSARSAEQSSSSSESSLQFAKTAHEISVELLESWNSVVESLGLQKPFGGPFDVNTGIVTLTLAGKTLLVTPDDTYTLNPDISTGAVQTLVFIAQNDGVFAGLTLVSGDELVATDSGWIVVPVSTGIIERERLSLSVRQSLERADNAVQIVSTTSTLMRLYGISANNRQTQTFDIQQNSSQSSTIPMRTNSTASDGLGSPMFTGTPTADGHAANKKYVDDEINTVSLTPGPPGPPGQNLSVSVNGIQRTGISFVRTGSTLTITTH